MESDEDVMEMTQEELQDWIRKEVNKSNVVDLSAGRRYQLLLEKRERQRAGLVELTQSVADCEAVIQHLYTLLGWDYRDEDSEAEDELQRKPPAMGGDAVEETSASRHGADADGDPIECDEKPKSKHKLASLEATSTHLGTDCCSPQWKRTRTRQDCSKLPTGEPSCSLAPRRRPVVLLERLPMHKIRSALRPPSPRPHDTGGCSGDEGLGVGCGSSPDDSWKGMAAAHARKTKSHSRISAKDNKRKIKSKSVTAERRNGEPPDGKTTVHRSRKPKTHSHTIADNKERKQPMTAAADNKKRNPDAPTSVIQQSCGTVVSSVSQSCSPSTTLPERKIRLSMKVLARHMATKWLPGEIVEIISTEGGRVFEYEVSLEERGRILVSGHHLAFADAPPLGRLYVGSRVVTKYRKDDESFFYSGILGELPSRQNRMRFLVFLDDHTPAYVGLPFLHLVCRPLEDPWADIAEDAHRTFIREYLKVWPYPPMAHYRVDQKLNVDCGGVQRACEVLHVDCSLMHVLFTHSGQREWIYRGSVRLEHLISMKKVLQEKDGAGEKKPSGASTGDPQDASPRSEPAVTPPPAATVNYTPHLCSPACLERVRPDGPVEVSHKCNPLVVPMMYKFRRVKKQVSPDPTATRVPVETKPSYSIYYYAPCGLTLSTIAQVEEYLHETRCDFLSMDAFSLDPRVSIAGVKPLPFKAFVRDLAGGWENKPVSCINEHNNLRPSGLNYRSVRNTSRVGLDSVAGCDCMDGCRDSESCSCRQLTIQSTGGPLGRPVDQDSGYAQKRLNRAVVTGVYECNARCRCDPRTCSNRVAQRGIQVRLQVFMTRDRGWGVRCLDDIPGGTFVCSYSGSVVFGNKENMISNAHYVKLNHIEGVELHKEDYETEVYRSDTETDDSPQQSTEPEENGGQSRGVANNKMKTKKFASPMVPMTTSRCFFDDHCYIIDANTEGNVARFLNHSCSPNLFKQYVFVDTHDLRFPWLTFFTSKRVTARTELTWDYRSVREDAETLLGQPCRCGSERCSVKL